MTQKAWKRLLVIVLTFLLLTSLLAGCVPSSTKPPEKTQEPSQKPTQEPSEVSDEPVTVKWIFLAEEQEDDDIVLAEINKLLLDRYNLQLDAVMIPMYEYTEKLGLMINANEYFDLCYTASWCNPYEPNMEKNAFYPLDELLFESEAGELLRNALPNLDRFLYAGRYVKDGKLYAIPNYQKQYSQHAIFIRKDLATEFGLDASTIKRVQDLEPFFDWILDNKQGIWPLVYSGTWNVFGMEQENRRSFDFIDVIKTDNGYECFPLDTTEFGIRQKEGIFDGSRKVLNSYYWKGYFREDIPALGEYDPNTDIANGKYAAFFGMHKPGAEAQKAAQLGYEWIMIGFGKLDLGSKPGDDTMTAISINSKNPEAAIKMLGVFWTDKEIYNMFTYGLENVHYKKIGENRVEQIAIDKYSKLDTYWSFGSVFNSYLIPGQPDDVWEQTRALNEAAIPPLWPDFVFDGEPIKTELGVFGEAGSEFQGQLDYTDKFDEMAKKLYEAKIEAYWDVIEAEFRKQFDAYLAGQ